MTKEEAFQKIKLLVDRFNEQLPYYKKGDYNETQTRREFIDPFFKALGWDIDNEQGLAEAYKDVIHEYKLKIKASTKAPDYCFTISGQPKFFVEAKKPSVFIKEDITPAYQVKRYGWNAKLAISLVTDFEEFAIYDCSKKPSPKDKTFTSRIKYLTHNEYLTEFDFLWETFAKERVLRGSFDKFIKSDASKKGTSTVDADFLHSMEEWRKQLATNIAINNHSFNEDDVNYVVQQTLDRIIFLKICEDRNIEPAGRLKSVLSGKQDYYNNLFDYFKEADAKYNSGLFDFKKDKLSPTVVIENKVLKSLINELENSDYLFNIIPVEILGYAYEQFLGKVIRITAGHRAKIEEKPEVRKAGGVFYTPKYIVDYIVQNTVGKILDGKTAEQVSKIKILDPACGSGSFLLGAYDFLLKWHINYYSKKSKGNKSAQLTPQGNLTSSVKKQILINNIFGVDLDEQAVEVTKLSLLLKCLEGETNASITQQMTMFKERVLPNLDNNIKAGNSLVDVDFYESQLDFGEEKKIKPFSYSKNFQHVFKQGGFDVVMGNPPYVDYRLLDAATVTYLQQKFSSTQVKEKWSLYIPFIQLSGNIIKENGVSAMIVPNTFLSADFGLKLRAHLIKERQLLEIIDVSKIKVFGNVGTYPVLLFFANAYKSVNSFTIANAASNDLSSLAITTLSQNEIKKNNDKYIISLNSDKTEIAIIRKLDKGSTKLKELINVFQWGTSIVGFKTYKISESEYIKLSKVDKLRYEKVLQTADIKSYNILWKKEYISKEIYSQNVQLLFSNRKIIIARLTKNIQATFDTEKHYLGKSSFIITNKIDNYILLALLNSNLLNFYYKHRFETTHLAGGYLRFDIPYLQELPISNNLNIKITQQITTFVTQILQLGKDLQTTKLENQKQQLNTKIEFCQDKINALVYELYNLTSDEIQIIEKK